MSLISQLASFPVYPTKVAEEQSLEKVFQAAISKATCKLQPKEFWSAFWKELKSKAPSHRFEELTISFLNKVIFHSEHCLNCISSFLNIGIAENFFQDWCEEIPVVRTAFWNREWQTLIQYLNQNNYSLSSQELQCLFIAEIESSHFPSLRNDTILNVLQTCKCWKLMQLSRRDSTILVDLLQNPQQVSLFQGVGERYFAQQYGVLFHYFCLSKGVLTYEGGYQFLLTADYVRYFNGELPLVQNPTPMNGFSSSFACEESLPDNSFNKPNPLDAVPPLQFSSNLQPLPPVQQREVVVIEDDEISSAPSSQQSSKQSRINSKPGKAPPQAAKTKQPPKITYRAQTTAPLSHGPAGPALAPSEFDKIAALHKSRILDIANPKEAAAKLMTIHNNGGFAYESVDAYVLLRDLVVTSEINEKIHFERLVPNLETFWTYYFNHMIAEFNSQQEPILWEIPFNSFPAIKTPTAYLTFFKVFTQFLPSFVDFEQIYGMALRSIQQENKLDSILFTMSQTGFRPLTCQLCEELKSIKTNLLQPQLNSDNYFTVQGGLTPQFNITNYLLDPTSDVIETGTAFETEIGDPLAIFSSLTSTEYDGF